MGKTHLFISNTELKNARHLFSRISLFIPVLAFVVFINFYVDPLGLYSRPVNKYEQPEYRVAQALAEGSNVELLSENKDDRLIQKYFVEDLTVAPDIAVLGSSHSMWLGENIFHDKKVINNSVLSAVLADYLGIFEGYAKRGLYPKTVICVLDPQLIVFPAASERWVSIKEDTYGMLGRLGIHSEKIKAPLVPQSLLNIFSFSYFQKAVDKTFRGKGGQDYQVTDAVTGRYLMFKDGRRFLGFLSKAPEMNRKKTVVELYHDSYAQELSRKKTDRELEDILGDFIKYLTDHHVQVILCMLPLHPDLYKSFLKPQKIPGSVDIAGFERYYRGLAQRSNVRIIGSYDPAACGLAGKDFYDVDHIRNDVMERLFSQKGTACSMPGL